MVLVCIAELHDVYDCFCVIDLLVHICTPKLGSYHRRCMIYPLTSYDQLLCQTGVYGRARKPKVVPIRPHLWH